MHFDAHAADYEHSRPPYPPALWQRLRDLGVLKPGLRAADLGAGTGQATGPLLSAGLRVTAVEPGPQLAARLRDLYPAVTVLRARAEDVELPAGSFDVVVAATSIHWMDLDVVLPKVHSWLTPGGFLLVWRNVFGDPGITTPFRERVADIVGKRKGSTRRLSPAEEVTSTATALARTGHFRVDETSTFRWSIELDERRARLLFATFSDWSGDEAEEAATAVRDLGGRVEEHYLSWLIVSRLSTG